LFGTVLLSSCLIPGIVTGTAQSDIDRALFYHNNRQLVTIEVTKPDNSKVDVGVPFMSIDLEESTASSSLPCFKG
jgi:hypothetical protein